MGWSVLEVVVSHEVREHPEAVVNYLLGCGLQQDEKSFVDFGLNDHPAELLDPCQIGHDP